MNDRQMVHISQGEYAVGASRTMCITTILGSCVAACLWDPEAGIGGMNHILLPDRAEGPSEYDSFGVNAMEVLINEIIKMGGNRHNLRAKLFGGATLNSRLRDIGAKNARFAVAFLEAEGIGCVAQSLGGQLARRVEFWPFDGRARQKLLKIAEEPAAPAPPPAPAAGGSEVELF